MNTKIDPNRHAASIDDLVKKNPDKILSTCYEDFIWRLKIMGPKNSVYENGTFEIEIYFPWGYFGHPYVVFNTPIFHPNVGNFNSGKKDLESGKMQLCYTHCLRFIEGETIVVSTLGRIFSVMEYPDLICEHNGQVSELFLNDKMLFNAIARDWTRSFAV